MVQRNDTQADWRPNPDPTTLTTEQLRREVTALREVIEARLDAMDKAAALLDESVNRTPTVIQTAIRNVREVYDERFDSADRRLRDADTRYQQRFEERDIRFQEEFKGVDLQFKERDIRIEQTSAARDAALAAALQAAKEAVNEQATAAARATEKAEESFKTILNGLRDIYNERFTSIHLQFTERDVRTEQAATASASALAAALQAAKEAVFEQAQAAAKAAEKTELSFTKQIDQIGLQIKTVSDGFGERISELKERIDRGEGSESGSKSHATETRLNVGAVVAGVSMLIALAAVLFAIFK